MKNYQKLAIVAFLAALAIPVAVHAGGDNKKGRKGPGGDIVVKDRENNTRNLTTTTGNITVGDGASVANVKVVTGSIDIGDGASTGMVKIVTGNIEIGTDCKIGGDTGAVTGDIRARERTSFDKGIKVVTGDVKLDGKNSVGASVSTVTGDIEIGPDSKVKGAVATVSGGIAILGPSTVQRVENVAGDVNLEKATVNKDVRLRKSKGASASTKVDTIRIGPGTHIKGSLVAEREVKLLVHSTAKIDGGIEGATAEPYGE